MLTKKSYSSILKVSCKTQERRKHYEQKSIKKHYGFE